MTGAQKVILIALAVAGMICLVVGFTLMHYIGSFMRTVEDEARKEAEAETASGEDGLAEAAQTSRKS